MTDAQTDTQTADHRALIDLIGQIHPRSLLTVGAAADSAGAAWQAQAGGDALHESMTPAQLANPVSFAHSVDLALVTDTLEALSHDDGDQLLGTLRNLGCHQIAVLVANEAAWSLADFLALGFRRQPPSGPDAEKTLYTYNLDTYNHKRAWNNPDHWANPEMWGKAWW
ncbi:DUF6231 family protein [Marinobacter sp. C2H3]|uniref:DUF6231 family protein n=1 Tax=Marinobacter sp. C2H3 TaxID=3119003 RepID=UPI00300E7CCA